MASPTAPSHRNAYGFKLAYLALCLGDKCRLEHSRPILIIAAIGRGVVRSVFAVLLEIEKEAQWKGSQTLKRNILTTGCLYRASDAKAVPRPETPHQDARRDFQSPVESVWPTFARQFHRHPAHALSHIQLHQPSRHLLHPWCFRPPVLGVFAQ
jgi:hypothetical protein